ncbi:hypothetical protein BDV12DRAFT_205290, partial [Aspergillus spectabilis]
MAVAQTTGEVVHPADGAAEIRGLPTMHGFLCHHDNLDNGDYCGYRSASVHQIRQHYNQAHGWKVEQDGAMPWKEASVQTLFCQKQLIRYFAVVPADHIAPEAGAYQYIYPRGPRRQQPPQQYDAGEGEAQPTAPANNNHRRGGTATDTDNNTNDSDTLPPPITRGAPRGRRRLPPPPADNHLITATLQEVQDLITPAVPAQLDAVSHRSDLTPWLTQTGIYTHLQGLQLSMVSDSYKLPKEEAEPILFLICESAGRLLRKAMSVLVHDQNMEVRQLSRRDAKLLNTFRRGETSQDPFSQLQNPQSRDKYITTWKQLLCYWERVVEQEQLRDSLFQPAAQQLETWEEATAAAAELQRQQGEQGEQGEQEEEEEEDPLAEARAQLDRAVLAFSMAIIQHHVPYRHFDSVLVSYAAVRFWQP